MKRKILIAVILILVSCSLLIYLRFVRPSDESVKREYLEMHPNVEVVKVEMIFDWEPKKIYTYLVEYREPSSSELRTDEFSIRQMWNSQRQWCSDQTERKCG